MIALGMQTFFLTFALEYLGFHYVQPALFKNNVLMAV